MGTLGKAHAFYHHPTNTHTQWPEDPGLQLAGKEQHDVMAGAATESEHGRATVCYAPVAQGSTSTGNAQPPRQAQSFLLCRKVLPTGAEDVVQLAECSLAFMKPWLSSPAPHRPGTGGTCL